MADNYYEILGIPKSASSAEIKRAFRKLAQQYHPDKGGGGDVKKFREINEAYEVLSDSAKKSQYDRYGQTFDQTQRQGASGFGGFGGFSDSAGFSDFAKGFGFGNFSSGGGSAFGGDFGDIFSDIFGSTRSSRRDRGVDLEMVLEIDFLEGVFGAEREASLDKKDACETCKGEGAEPGSKIITCPKCHGQGQILTHHKTILGNIQQARTCDECEGRGRVPEKKCKECAGSGVKQRTKTVKIIIPPGIDTDQRIKIPGAGEAGYRGSKTGDLYVRIKVRPHEYFKRQGQEIYSEVPISFYQAALGTKVEIATVDGPVELKIPAGIQSGKVLRLKNKGVPYLESNKRGDHLATVRVVTPQRLSRKEKEILKQLAESKGETVDIDEGLWKKIKDSFDNS